MSYIPRLISVSRAICPVSGIHYLDGISDMGAVWCLDLSPDEEGKITPGEKSWKQLKLPQRGCDRGRLTEPKIRFFRFRLVTI